MVGDEGDYVRKSAARCAGIGPPLEANEARRPSAFQLSWPPPEEMTDAIAVIPNPTGSHPSRAEAQARHAVDPARPRATSSMRCPQVGPSLLLRRPSLGAASWWVSAYSGQQRVTLGIVR